MLTTLFLIFSAGLLISFFLTWCVRGLAHACGFLSPPQVDRHVHTIPLPRIGGVAVYASFLIVVGALLLITGHPGVPVILPLKATLILLGTTLPVFLLGLYDDLLGVGPYWKFSVQAFAAALLYFGGFGIQRLDLFSSGKVFSSYIGLPLTILWVLLITNAFNLIDGLDGLAAGSAVFSTVVVLILSLVVPNPLVTCLAIALAGTILGFLRFNFYPASIFLGDSGSLFIGFILSALALAGSQKAPTMVAVAIPVVSLGLPILDVILAVMRRFLRGTPLFRGDQDHIHHRLLKRGFCQRDAVLILYAVTAGFGFLSLVLLHRGGMIALVLGVTSIGVLIGVQQLHYLEFKELVSMLRRGTHGRQMLANHVAVRQAAQALQDYDEFPSICQVLQQTLQPIGFDGVRLNMLSPNGFAPSAFLPFQYGPDGILQVTWSASAMGQAPWELRLELSTSSHGRWGYLTLIRMSGGETLPLDVNLLTGGFCNSLSNAVYRACARLEVIEEDGLEMHKSKVRQSAAGSMAD